MAFSDDEKARIRYHLGYANVTFAFTFVLGVYAKIPFQSIVEGAMTQALPEIESQVRLLLQRLDQTEAQMFDNQELLAIDGIGSIQIRKDGQPKTRDQYAYWAAALGNIFNVEPNPYDQRFMGNGINVPVQG
jgi:hypothetical protein